MPRVPTAEPQVEARGIPSVRQDTIASPALFASSSVGLAEAGAGFLKAGDAMAKVVIAQQDRENTDMVFRAETTLRDEYRAHEESVNQRKGSDAWGVAKETEKWWQDTARKHVETLQNDAQRRAFMQQASKLRGQSLDSITRYENDQRRASVDQSASASIASLISTAAQAAGNGTLFTPVTKTDADGNPIAAGSRLADIRSDILKRVAVRGKLAGWGPELKALEEEKALTNLHKQVIQALVVSDPGAATKYFNDNKGEIAGDQHAEIGQFAQKAGATALGNEAARTVWGEMAPKSSADPVRLADMEGAIRERLKGNEAAIDTAVKEVRSLASAYRDQRKEQGNALEAGVNGLILGGQSSSQIRRSAEFIKLASTDPESARKIDAYLESRDHTREARALAAANRGLIEDERADRRRNLQGFDVALRLSDPAVLTGLSRDEVVNLLPQLGRTHTQNLLNKWDEFKKNSAALSEAKIDNDQFNSFAARAGFDPSNKKDKANTRGIVELRDRIERIIASEQQAAKRPLTREQKDVIMQREIDNKVMQDRSFWWDKEVPAISLPADAQGRAYVEVGPKKTEVKLADIPRDFREQAMAFRRTQGLSTSEEQLAELWLLQKSTWTNRNQQIRR